MPVLPGLPVESVYRLLSQTLSQIFPEGGQRLARRNAWSAMSANARRAREHREAVAALAATQTANLTRQTQTAASRGIRAN